MVSFKKDTHGKVRKGARAGDADGLSAQLFDTLGFFIAEQRVVHEVRLRGNDVHVQTAGFAPDRGLRAAHARKVHVRGNQRGDGGWSAANKYRFDKKPLVFEKSFR